ncbi:MAG: hypothetical protein U0744_06750 [Gemmataceae bacterium]
MVKVLQSFGFAQPDLQSGLFLKPEKMLRMGVRPVRIEIHNDISGVAFDACYARHIESRWERAKGLVISFEDLLANKLASARHKDWADVETLRACEPVGEAASVGSRFSLIRLATLAGIVRRTTQRLTR